MADAVAEKRGAQVALVFGRLLPKGYSRESFAGKKANTLDPARLAELGRFIEGGQKVLGVPGVALGLVQDGKVVFADGFGTKELGRSGKPDGDTLFMVASNTKAMTTLELTLDLPTGSEPGDYDVQLTQGTSQPVARASARAELVDGVAVLKVRIDLGKANVGPASLLVRRSGQSWSTYALMLK